MKGRISIRTKITLWFATALVLIVALTYWVVLSVSKQVIQKTIRDNLIVAVENNVDEVEFFDSADSLFAINDVDRYMTYRDGFLEIDDDFLDEVNQIYTSLYRSDGFLLYGENPIARETVDLKFADSQLQSMGVQGVQYYIFDRKLSQKGLEGLWMRGVVAETQGSIQTDSIFRTSLVLLPMLVLFTVVGGFLIAGRMLRPIKQISDTAAVISRGDDLKKRIEVGAGRDELHQLADSFNQMFERLDKAFQTERQFTSDASHEIRTPLSVMLAQCELSLESDGTPQEYREALQLIERQGRKMAGMVNTMLDFARLELKSDRYVKTQVDLSFLASTVCEDMALIREKNIALQTCIEEGIYCIGCRELLVRLLANLIGNAYRYGKQDGHILVSLQTEGEQVCLGVGDDGIGIPEEEQDKIFERFYRADTARSGEGTGLGLAMVKEIARFHKGEIRVESRVGEGSVFYFILPLHRTEEN